LKKAHELLSSGFRRSETASKLGVKYDTLNKAIQDGRIKIELPSASSSETDKSSRSFTDYVAAEGFGIACTRPWERTLAAFGLLKTAESRFERCNDVTNGGVMTA
jgi:hypothetical protein